MVGYPIEPEKIFLTNLYEIGRTTLDYQELELRAETERARYILVKMQRGWTGSWNIHREDEVTFSLLFRTRPDWSKAQDEGVWWITDDGQLRAESGFESIEGTGYPSITFERGLERHMQDLLVASWIAKLRSENITFEKA
ncbi:hypothetical protein MMC29_007512 [Sticta canariensis]|nr:hypothetical protein [Sticta canariensis]